MKPGPKIRCPYLADKYLVLRIERGMSEADVVRVWKKRRAVAVKVAGGTFKPEALVATGVTNPFASELGWRLLLGVSRREREAA